MLDRAGSDAQVSRHRGAFMLGLWPHANGDTAEGAEACAAEYAKRVCGIKGSFSLGEAVTASHSAYRSPHTPPWTRQNGAWTTADRGEDHSR